MLLAAGGPAHRQLDFAKRPERTVDRLKVGRQIVVNAGERAVQELADELGARHPLLRG